MRIMGMVIITALSFSILLADEQDNNKSQMDKERIEEQLLYEQIKKAYQEDVAAAKRIQNQYDKLNTTTDINNKTDTKKKDDKIVKNKTKEVNKIETEIESNIEIEE